MPAEQIKSQKKLFLARHYGFCNGVKRAIDTVNAVLQSVPENETIYIYNEIVHNSFVVNNLKSRGVKFVHSLDAVPPGSMIIWSAHGVPPELEDEARQRRLTIKDATCPLVKRLHDLASKYSQDGDAVIFIGHANHPESIGVLGCGNIRCVSNADDCYALPDFSPDQKIYVLTQTTWCSNETDVLLEVLKKRYPNLELVSGSCYATTERQQSVRDLIQQQHIEQLLVIGSPKSSNSNRLCEVAMQYNVPAQLVDDPEQIEFMEFNTVSTLGITAGASAPDILLQRSLEILQKKHNFNLEEGTI